MDTLCIDSSVETHCRWCTAPALSPVSMLAAAQPGPVAAVTRVTSAAQPREQRSVAAVNSDSADVARGAPEPDIGVTSDTGRQHVTPERIEETVRSEWRMSSERRVVCHNTRVHSVSLYSLSSTGWACLGLAGRECTFSLQSRNGFSQR